MFETSLWEGKQAALLKEKQAAVGSTKTTAQGMVRISRLAGCITLP
jgi:hypothetical protein